MLTFISDQPATDASLPILGIDPLTDGVPAGGVPFLFDLLKDFEASHADAAYANGDVITDLSETGDGSVVIAAGSGNAVASGATYGGADFSGATLRGDVIRAPAGVLNAIHAGNQYFAVAFWVVLPSAADWNTQAAICPFFCATASGNGYTTPEADLVTICQAAGGFLQARRQTDGGSTKDQLNILVDAAAYGKLALVMFWRNAAGSGIRLKTSASDQTTAAAAGVANTGDFSNQQPRWGVTASFWSGTVPMPAAYQAASNFTLLRGWLENQEISGSNPTAVFDDEWSRVYARLTSI